MTGLYFVDSCVLVYAKDLTDPFKQERAADWLHALTEGKSGRLSQQSLNEYYNVVTRKLKPGLPFDIARDDVRRLAGWAFLPDHADTLEAAWAIEERYSISWWDALIVAAAQLQGCRYLLTEDLQHGQRFGELEVVNPFVVEPSAVP